MSIRERLLTILFLFILTPILFLSLLIVLIKFGIELLNSWSCCISILQLTLVWFLQLWPLVENIELFLSYTIDELRVRRMESYSTLCSSSLSLCSLMLWYTSLSGVPDNVDSDSLSFSPSFSLCFVCFLNVLWSGWMFLLSKICSRSMTASLLVAFLTILVASFGGS